MNATITTTLDPESELWAANDEAARTLIPAMAYVAVLMLLGIAGNLLVCFVFFLRLRMCTQGYLIIALAVFDLLSCTVTMPTEIWVMRFLLVLDNESACRLLRCFNHFSAMASNMTLIVIAGDRYLKICHPLQKQMTLRHVKVALLVVTALAVLAAIPAAILNGIRTAKVAGLRKPTRACSYDDSVKDTVYPFAYSILLFTGFGLGLLTLTVVYVKIWRELKRHFNYMATHVIASHWSSISSAGSGSGVTRRSFLGSRLSLLWAIGNDPDEFTMRPSTYYAKFAVGQSNNQGNSTQGQSNDQGKSTHEQSNDQGKSTQGQCNDPSKSTQGQSNDQGKSTQGQSNDQGKSTQGHRNDPGMSTQGHSNDQGKSAQGQSNDQGKSKQGQSNDQGKSKQGQSNDQGKSAQGQSNDQGKSTWGHSIDQGKSTQGHSNEPGKSTRGHSIGQGKSTRGHSNEPGKSTQGHSIDQGKSTRGHSNEPGKSTQAHSIDQGKSTRGHGIDQGKSTRGHSNEPGKSTRGHSNDPGKSTQRQSAVTGSEGKRSVHGDSELSTELCNMWKLSSTSSAADLDVTESGASEDKDISSVTLSSFSMGSTDSSVTDHAFGDIEASALHVQEVAVGNYDKKTGQATKQPVGTDRDPMASDRSSKALPAKIPGEGDKEGETRASTAQDIRESADRTGAPTPYVTPQAPGHTVLTETTTHIAKGPSVTFQALADKVLTESTTHRASAPYVKPQAPAHTARTESTTHNASGQKYPSGKTSLLDRLLCKKRKIQDGASVVVASAAAVSSLSLLSDSQYIAEATVMAAHSEMTKGEPELNASDEVARKKNEFKALRWQTLRNARRKSPGSTSTIVAICITVVFFLSFMPHLSLVTVSNVHVDFDLKLQGASLLCYHIFLRSYFINSVSNPIIYGVLNPRFRSEVVGLCWSDNK